MGISEAPELAEFVSPRVLRTDMNPELHPRHTVPVFPGSGPVLSNDATAERFPWLWAAESSLRSLAAHGHSGDEILQAVQSRWSADEPARCFEGTLRVGLATLHPVGHLDRLVVGRQQDSVPTDFATGTDGMDADFAGLPRGGPRPAAVDQRAGSALARGEQ